MQLRVVLLLSFCVVILYSRYSAGAEENDDHTETSTGDTDPVSGCIGSKQSVIAIVNASNNYLLDNVIVNCLAFSNEDSVISLGVVSHEQGVTLSRSTVRCVNDVLVVSGSSQSFDGNMTSCHECEDSQELDMCPNDAGQSMHWGVTPTPPSIFIIIIITILES